MFGGKMPGGLPPGMPDPSKMDPAELERLAREMGIDPAAVPGGLPGPAPKTMADKLPSDVGALLKNAGGPGGSRFPGLPGLGGGFVPRKK
jgi:signal recognition particle subunit SRP54